MKSTSTQTLLNKLNRQHLRTHRRYEEFFWRSYMGDHSVDVEKDAALTARDRFQSNRQLRDDVAQAIAIAKGKEKKRLQTWLKFFDLHQIPSELQPLKTKINELETVMHQQQTGRREGYIDPKTKKFVSTSRLKMRGMVRTEADESIRKACFEALEDLASESLAEYIQYVGLLNQYAQGLGFEDFYSYKIQTEEGMSKAELFTLFDALYHKTKFAFADIRRLEKRQRGLRQPWNY
ncbi:MAG: hypothetical protein KBB55_03285, partial [Candidatus Buchananbacteria bacterium]|nr:hypothetical protein [Candidatus Buchananbacteria bacterium]